MFANFTPLCADNRFLHRVTLVHTQETIVSMMRHPLPELATQHMRDIDVDLVLSDRVLSHEGGFVTLASGRRLACDLFIPAHATGGNSNFLPAAAVDKRGYAVVDDTFTVNSFTNVFALGDW